MIDNPGRRDLLLAGSLAVLAGGTLAPLRAEARRVGSPGTEFVEVTSPFGPRYIGWLLSGFGVMEKPLGW